MAVKFTYTTIPNNYVRNGALIHTSSVKIGVRAGTSLPGWKSVIKSGGNASTPYTADIYSVISAEPLAATMNVWLKFYEGYPYWNDPYTISYGLTGYPLDLNSYDILSHAKSTSAQDEADALNRLYNKIRQESYGTNSLLLLGELRETIRMFRHPLASAKDLIDSFHEDLILNSLRVGRRVKRRKGEARRQWYRRKANALKDAMSGSWLALQFGLKPVISDVEDIAGTVHGLLANNAKRRKLQSRSKAQPAVRTNFDYKASYLEENLYHNNYSVTTTEASIQYIAFMFSRVSGPEVSTDWVKELGFQFQNFIPTVYELIPWSFLFDYFVNLGQVLEAVCTDTSGFSGGCKTIKQDSYTFISESLSTYESSNWVPNLTGKRDAHRVIRHVTMSREVVDSLPIPPIVTSVPGTDSTKWYNMAALLAQTNWSAFR